MFPARDMNLRSEDLLRKNLLLERQNLLLKLLTGWLAIPLIAAWYSGPTIHEELKARKLTIVDSKGREVAFMDSGSEDEGGRLTLTTPSTGAPATSPGRAIGLVVTKQEAVCFFVGKKSGSGELPMLQVGVGEKFDGAGGLKIPNARGKTVVAAGASPNDNRGMVATFDADGVVTGGLGAK